jgi:hypothetical protein
VFSYRVTGHMSAAVLCRLTRVCRCTFRFRPPAQQEQPWTKELKDTNPLMSSLLVICFGCCSNFVGSEYGQKQSVKLLQNMVYSTIQHPPPQSHTLSVYTIHLVWGGGEEVREKEEGQQCTSIVPSTTCPWGQQFTSWVENTNH